MMNCSVLEGAAACGSERSATPSRSFLQRIDVVHSRKPLEVVIRRVDAGAVLDSQGRDMSIRRQVAGSR